MAFATETVYGLGAVATDPAAVARIFEAKGRPSFNPLIVHVQGIDQAQVGARHWPRDRRTAGRPVLARTADAGSAPFADRSPTWSPAAETPWRCESRPPRVARGLIEHVGQPLAAPSANRSNRLSPTRAEHVLADLDGRIDLILDSGPTSVGLESTVLDLTSSPLRILRPGPIGPEEIASCLKVTNRLCSRRRTRPGLVRTLRPAPACSKSIMLRARRRFAWTRPRSWRGFPGRSGPRCIVLGSVDLPDSCFLASVSEASRASRRGPETLSGLA